MFFLQILANVFLVVYVTITIIKCKDAEKPVDENVEKSDVHLLEDYTFVALIDIVFTDGSQRTCTGSIIHDNVVITAAHCFTKENNREVTPELTASFVVIGTKKMFDTGYEQYLPIERVLTHPEFSEWNADLSLVYTFAGMTSDKPGTIIAIASKWSANADSNLTVLSWGKMKEYSQNDMISKQEKTEEENSCSGSASKEDEKEQNSEEVMHPTMLQSTRVHPSKNQRAQNIQKGVSKRNTVKKPDELKATPKTKVISRYLSSEEGSKESKISQKSVPHNMFRTKSNNWNWRRVMGSQDNKLTVEKFNLVDIRECKKLLKKAEIVVLSDINIVCYTAQGHFISDKDSGAPLVHGGQLAAVTIGGVEYDGEYLALGMKMNCYCSWVAQNVPNGADLFDCTKTCYDVGDEKDLTRYMNYKNKKFLI